MKVGKLIRNMAYLSKIEIIKQRDRKDDDVMLYIGSAREVPKNIRKMKIIEIDAAYGWIIAYV